MSTLRVRRRIHTDRAVTTIAATAVIGLTVAAMVALSPAAAAALPGAETAVASASAEGKDGQRLEATPTTDLPAEGGQITVTGSGYDDFKGLYVAVCKVPEDGGVPTPCGGGIDTEGASGSSQWVSSNPPSYGEGLAVPYGKNGSFEVSVTASAVLASGEDCREVACAVVTRADHTRTSDRSQDVLIPVTFASTDDAGSTDDTAAGPTTTTVLGVVGLGLLLAVVAALVTVLRMRRRAPASPQDPA
jgi:hypothetical protein